MGKKGERRPHLPRPREEEFRERVRNTPTFDSDWRSEPPLFFAADSGEIEECGE